jgi:hypothetical protein
MKWTFWVELIACFVLVNEYLSKSFLALLETCFTFFSPKSSDIFASDGYFKIRTHHGHG